MEEEIPRRLRRFYREGEEKPTESEVKDKSAELAIKHVDNFKREQGRYPQGKELEEISQNVFEQLKRELSAEHTMEDDISEEMGLEKAIKEQDKSFLEMRKEKRAQLKKGEEGAKKNQVSKGKNARQKREEKKAAKPSAGEEELEELDSEETISGNESPVGMEGEEMPELSEEIDSQTEPAENVKKLAEMDELSSLGEELSDDDSDMVEKDLETDLNVCPNCNTKTDDLIYCPNCGEAFCDHCAKTVEVQSQTVKYTCPKCGNEFKKNK